MDEQRSEMMGEDRIGPPAMPTDEEMMAEARAGFGEDATAPDSPLPAFWEAVKRLPRYAAVVAILLKDPAVPRKAKATLGLGGAYSVSPIDLVPGVIPIAGQLDDIYVLLRALSATLDAIPPEVAASSLRRVGLTMTDVEQDIQAVEASARWLVARGAQHSGRLATRGYRHVRAGLQRGSDVIQQAAARYVKRPGDAPPAGS